MPLTLVDAGGVRGGEACDARAEASAELLSADERRGETSRAFFSFLAALSLLVVSLSVSARGGARPGIVLFWLLVGGLSAFMAFGAKGRETD